MWTSAPPARSRSTVAAPMPLVPPVTSATLPSKPYRFATRHFYTVPALADGIRGSATLTLCLLLKAFPQAAHVRLHRMARHPVVGPEVAEVDRGLDRSEVPLGPADRVGRPAEVVGERSAELGNELIATPPELVSLLRGVKN